MSFGLPGPPVFLTSQVTPCGCCGTRRDDAVKVLSTEPGTRTHRTSALMGSSSKSLGSTARRHLGMSFLPPVLDDHREQLEAPTAMDTVVSGPAWPPRDTRPSGTHSQPTMGASSPASAAGPGALYNRKPEFTLSCAQLVSVTRGGANGQKARRSPVPSAARLPRVLTLQACEEAGVRDTRVSLGKDQGTKFPKDRALRERGR